MPRLSASGSRRPPESSPSVAGGSSCISRERPSRLPAGASRPRAAVRSRAAGFLLGFAALLALPLQAEAQTTYVSNIGQADNAGELATYFDLGQGFTTGTDAAGYTLGSVDIRLRSPNDVSGSAIPTVSIVQGTPSGTVVAMLIPPASLTADTTAADYTFTAPANTTLIASTTYYVVIVMEAGHATIAMPRTKSSSEDSGGESDWSIADDSHWRMPGSNGNFNTSATYVFLITVKGPGGTTLSTDATLSALTVNDGTTEHTIDLASTSYTLDVGNAVTTVTLTATPTHTGASVTAVTLGGTAIADTDFTDGITVPSLAEGDNDIVVTVTAEDGSATETYTVTVTRAGAGIPVTIEAEHESIGGGVEDLKYTLARTGATTDPLTVTVTLTQDQNWLTSTYLTHEVEFAAGEATNELIIEDSRFSFDPTTSGNLVATVTGTGVAGGTDTFMVISIADPPITIAFDQDAYTFPEGGPADEVDIYVTATLDAAFTRKPSSDFSIATSTGGGTATSPEDYDQFTRFLRFTPTDFTANSDGQQVASFLVGPSVGDRLVIVDDEIYEVNETFNVNVETNPDLRAGLARVKKADGTFCTLGISGCARPYPVTITDEEDLPTLSLAATPASIAEEDDATTTGTVENVSTVTVEITNSKTFAVDQTVTLTLSGTATQGTHYSVSPGDADTNTADHQVVLVKETASVEVTVTATGNDTDDGSRTVTVAADLDGTAVGSTDITILDDDTTTAPTEPGAPTGLTATASGTSTIDLDWTEPSDDGDASITGYRIEVSPNGSSSSWSDLVANTNNNTTTYSHTGLSAGTTRHYRVSAINSVGTGAASRTANATTDAAAPTEPGAPTGLTAKKEDGQRDQHDRPRLDRAVRRRRRLDHRLQDRGFAQWQLVELERPRGQHQQQHHHLLPHRPFRRHHPPLPRLGHQLGRHRHRLPHRQRHHRRRRPHRARRPDRPHGNGQRDQHDQPRLDRAVRRRRRLDHRLQDRGFAQWQLVELERPRGQHQQQHHHLLPHRPFRRHHPPLPRLGHQLGRHRHRLPHRQRHHPHRARRPDRPHGNGQRDQHDRPRLDRAVRRRRRLDHRLQDRGFAQWQLVELERPRGQHQQQHHHLLPHRPFRRHHPPLPRLGHQLGRHRHRLPHRQRHHRRRRPHRARRPDRPHGNGQRDQHDRPRLDRAVRRRRRLDHRLQDRGFAQWQLVELERPRGQHQQQHHHLLPHRPFRRHHPPLPRLGHQLGRHRRRLPHRQRHHRRRRPHRARRPDRPNGNGQRDQHDRPRLDQPSDDGDASITGYKIEVSPNGSSSSWSAVANTNNNTTTYSHTGLSAGTTRHYRVSAINSVGTGAASSTANATTPTEPGAPTGLTATASGTSTIDLDWTEPSDDGDASITGYRIEVSPNGSSGWSNLVANTNNTTTSYSHTGLTAGTTRHYRVSAINSVGTGTASSTANATTDAAAPTEPGAPTGLTATASGTSTINLTWTEPSDDGDASITGYTIEVSPNGSSGWSNLVGNTNNTTTTYSHTGLSTGTTRHYRVSAINSVGTGTASRTANATTGTDTGPLVLTVQAVSATVTEGEPVRYRILMSRPTSGALVESEYSYEGEFVRNGPASVVTGVSSQNGMTYWEIGYETLDDAMVEEDGSFTVRILKPDADLYNQGEVYTVGTPSSVTVTILDNDAEETPTLPIVSVFDVRVDEGPGAVLAFPVRLNVAAVETATIEWETLNGSAKAGRDYKKASGTLVFSPGDTEKTVRVEVIDDDEVEGTEVMLLLLLDAQGAVIDDAVAKGTIKDNDAASDAASDAADDALEDALALVDDLTPGVAAAVLLGEQTLGEAELAALDRLGNGNGRYDLGDLLSWIDRCRRGEARCGRTSTDSGPAAAALLGGAAVGGRSTPKRPGRRDSGCRGRASTGGIRRRARMAGQVLAVLLAATTAWSCTEGSVAPVAPKPDPGFLTVEWSGPATHRDVGVLLELEGPTIDAVRAPGLELYESSSPGPRRIVVAGVLRPGPLVQLRVPDRNQFALYRVRVLQVTGEGYGLRDPTEYRAVVIMN